jgi:hypothetical protein
LVDRGIPLVAQARVVDWKIRADRLIIETLLMAIPKNAIFVCYRRQDAADSVDRICDALETDFPADAIYRDLDSIPVGTDFPLHVRRAISECTVALIVIGPSWLNAADANGRRRLDDPSDYLRVEIETALRMPDVVVIPVFVREARMPAEHELPESLRPLTRRNGLAVRPRPHFDSDIARLKVALHDAIAAMTTRRAERARRADQAGAAARSAPELRVTRLDEEDWNELLNRIESGTLAVVLGPDFATTELDGVIASVHQHLATAVTERLDQAPIAIGTRHPLRAAAMQCERTGGSAQAFASALYDVSVRLSMTPPELLLELVQVTGLRFFVTTSLDGSIEAALISRGFSPPISLVPRSRFAREASDHESDPDRTVVVHVAGIIDVVPSAAFTEADWLDWAAELQTATSRNRYLLDRLATCALLFLGGGHPTGFIPLLLRLARGRSARLVNPAWLGASALDDPTVLDTLGVGSSARVFDDEGTEGFVTELRQRWAMRSLSQSRGQPKTARDRFESPSVQADLAMPSAIQTDSPWPGLRPFGEPEASQFRGRRREIAELVRAIRIEPVTVFFGQSGTGKTSLLRAGVMPALFKDGFLPIYLRIDAGPTMQPLVRQVQTAVEAACATLGIDASDKTDDSTLWGYFHRKARTYQTAHGRFLQPVLIVDQFDEFFTRFDKTEIGMRQRLAIADEFAHLAENRPPSEIVLAGQADPRSLVAYDFTKAAVPIVFSVREDYLGEVHELADRIPGILRSPVRLSGLTPSDAIDAAVSTAPGLIAREAAERLVAVLTESGRVAPAMLSMVMLELDRRRRAAGLPEITSEMISVFDPATMFAEHYERALADLPRNMRTLIRKVLVTDSGTRDSVARERAEREFGIPRDAIEVLLQRRVLRAITERGTTRIELAHDLLVPAVLGQRTS